MPENMTPLWLLHRSPGKPTASAVASMDPFLALQAEDTVARFFAGQPVEEATDDSLFDGDDDQDRDGEEEEDDDDELADRLAALEERLTHVEAAVARPGGLALADLQGSASIAESLGRIADALAPTPADTVGSPYVAERLGCTTVWVAELVRLGRIPKHCLVPGTGNGKPWKFIRRHIDKWIASR
jgi:hypothetical protein